MEDIRPRTITGSGNNDADSGVPGWRYITRSFEGCLRHVMVYHHVILFFLYFVWNGFLASRDIGYHIKETASSEAVAPSTVS